MGYQNKTLNNMYKELGQLDKRRRELLNAIHSNPTYIEQWVQYNIDEMKKSYYKHTNTGHIGVISNIKISVVTGPKKTTPEQISCEVFFNLYDEKNIQYIKKIEFYVTISSRKEIEKQIINNLFTVLTEKEYTKQKTLLEKKNANAIKKQKLEEELKRIKEQELKIQKELLALK